MTRIATGRQRAYRFLCRVQAHRAAKRWTKLHVRHVATTGVNSGRHRKDDALRVARFQEILASSMHQWIQNHDFQKGAFKMGGEFHPDGRLTAIASSVGIIRPLDAFPPHTVVDVYPTRIKVRALPLAAA